MAYYGDPLGLNWFPMLALYSSLGKSSNSYEEKCQIGSQLQKLDGKDRVVIEGISNKIDQLISRNNVSLSPTDMASLKSSIVSELGTIASQYGNQSSGPVMCDADSLVFDEDVKSLLSDLVRDKATGFYPRDTPSSTETDENVSTQDIIDEISHQIHQSIMAPDHFKGNLYSKKLPRLLEMLETDNKKLSVNSNTPGIEMADNSRYVRDNPYFEWDRTISIDKLMDSITKRYKKIKNKKVPTGIRDKIVDAFNSSVNGIYTYNDVELLRLVHALVIMEK